jgi:catechol 2,3-dioxygenase-like lactoylglutathione lyase family enzyme
VFTAAGTVARLHGELTPELYAALREEGPGGSAEHAIGDTLTFVPFRKLPPWFKWRKVMTSVRDKLEGWWLRSEDVIGGALEGPAGAPFLKNTKPPPMNSFNGNCPVGICALDLVTRSCESLLVRCELHRKSRSRQTYHGGMALDLYAGIPVNDYAAALHWYERLLGSPPTFIASDTEAVWELAEHRSVFIEHRPGHAGHAMHTIFVDDFDTRVAQIADRGLEPTKRETYPNGVRKAIYHDPDGNEVGFGGAPL